MVIQFTLQELMIFLICALAIVAGVILIPTLWNIKKVFGILRPIVETNEAAMKKSFGTIPGIIENIGQISSDAKETTVKLKTSVPVILQDVQHAAGSAKVSIDSVGIIVEDIGSSIDSGFLSPKNDTSDSTSGFMAYLPVIREVLQLVSRAFPSGK